MIALATMLRIAEKRGQSIGTWLAAYGVVVALTCIVVLMTRVPLLAVVFEGVFVLVFLASYHLLSDEERAAMRPTVNALQVANAMEERFEASLAQWEVAKAYVDTSQQLELHRDHGLLERHGIRCFVRTAGITTLMVPRDRLDQALALLGLPPGEATAADAETVRQ